MASAGLASGFRLAMVAQRSRAFSVYRSAEQGATQQGRSGARFPYRREAVQWLTGTARNRDS